MDDPERRPEAVAFEPALSPTAYPDRSDVGLAVGLSRRSHTRPVALALLAISVAAPFLKGLIAGLTLAGAAAAVSAVLGIGQP